jgi:integrase
MMRERIGLPLQDYQRLQQPKDWESSGRALDDTERETVEKICRIFAEHPRWKTAAFAAMLSMKSGLTRAEMLSLKLKDCCLEPPKVEIPRRGAKRKSRERVVHLGKDGAWALENLITRAMDECGSADGEHFLFPFQNYDKTFDPTKPGKHYRAGMKKIFEVAGLTNFKPKDFRHDAVSVALSDSSVPLQAAVRHFGWVSPKMVQKYYHESQKESQIVAAAIEARKDAKPVKKLWIPRKPVKTAS